MTSLYLDELAWAGLVAATKAGIKRLNTFAEKHGRSDHFSLSVDNGTSNFHKGHALIETRRYDYHHTEFAGVARNKATGEIRQVKYTEDRYGCTLCKIKPAKKWATLSGKPSEEVVRGLGLLAYRTLVSVRSELVA